MSIDEVTRKEQIMECMIGKDCKWSYIKMPNKEYYCCTLIHSIADTMPYDCCFRGKVVMDLIDKQTRESIKTYYQCKREIK